MKFIWEKDMLHDKLKNYFEEQKEEYLKIFTDLVSIDTQAIEQGIGGGKEMKDPFCLTAI